MFISVCFSSDDYVEIVFLVCVYEKNRISEHSQVLPIIYGINTFTSTEFGFLNFNLAFLSISTNYSIVSLASAPG